MTMDRLLGLCMVGLSSMVLFAQQISVELIREYGLGVGVFLMNGILLVKVNNLEKMFCELRKNIEGPDGLISRVARLEERGAMDRK